MKEKDDFLKCLTDLFDSLESVSDCSDAPLPVELCKQMPCMGTPGEIAELINAGYGRILHPMTVVAMAANKGNIVAAKPIPMVHLMTDNTGCVMCKDGKCLLWQSGLTPIMGKLHLLCGGLKAKHLKFLIHVTIMEWLNPHNASQIRDCFKSMEAIDKNIDNNHTN